MNVTAPKVYVVTLNWNGASDTIACAESLRGLQHPCCAFVICDNASRPDDLARLRAWGATLPGGLPEIDAEAIAPVAPGSAPQREGQFVMVHTGANRGYAGGMNAGLRHALAQGDADYAWVLNNDTAVAPDALAPLLARMQADPTIGICGSTLIYFDRRDQVQALGGSAYDAWRARSRALGAFSATASVPPDPTEVEAQLAYVVGAAMLVSRDFLQRVGLMDERYFLYSEEHDWAHRGRQAGFRLAWAPASQVFHKHGATIGTAASGGSTLSLFYLYRNKLLFTARHYPTWLPSALVMLTWEGLKFALKGHPGKAWAVWRGLAAALGRGRF